MGIVFAARDRRLDRPVALKRIRPGQTDGQERERFWREARAAASVNHPNVCQLYEIDEDADGLYLAMELLDGQSLGERLGRGPLPPGEAVPIALAVLSALAALHQKGIVHRDLKPSNIFLSTNGVKLLDFGLARPFLSADGSNANDVTRPGMLLGTPSYLAPELIEGQIADARSDLFAMGIVLYEMLVGAPPFRGGSVVAVASAILKDEPPALGGSAAGVVGLDRVVHRALRKSAAERYQTADAFAQDLRTTLLGTETGDVARIRPLSRLVVLPFRLLRSDPSVEFLAFSLPDAISSALSDLPSLVVRSTAAATRFAGDPPDIPAVSRALDVDVVLLGTLLSSGDQIRVSAQLVEAPSGTLVRAITAQSGGGEIFQLQDSLAKSIVESLSLSLTPTDRGRINRDAPADPEAYECYLRANRILLESKQWASARDLYLRCLDLDSRFAPAWARLGRCYRLLGKYDDPSQAQANLAKGEQALRRALDLNPDLSLAHNLYAHAEVDAGRAREAIVRLLQRLRRAASEPELFAGLVHACRYCGLLDASVAADERARSLDPAVRTSVAQTFILKGDWERAMAADRSDPPFTTTHALMELGRGAEAVALLRKHVTRGSQPQLDHLLEAMLASLESRHEDVIRETHALLDSGFGDHEVFYHWSAALAQAGDVDGSLNLLERAISGGFHPASALARDRRFDPLRGMSDFRQLVRHADDLQRAALEAFRQADGPRLLGLPEI